MEISELLKVYNTYAKLMSWNPCGANKIQHSIFNNTLIHMYRESYRGTITAYYCVERSPNFSFKEPVVHEHCKIYEEPPYISYIHECAIFLDLPYLLLLIDANA